MTAPSEQAMKAMRRLWGIGVYCAARPNDIARALDDFAPAHDALVDALRVAVDSYEDNGQIRGRDLAAARAALQLAEEG